MNDQSFINLKMYLVFSPFHSGKTNLGCITNWDSNLISSDMSSKGFHKVEVSFWKHVAETWFRIDKMSILTGCILMQSITKWLLN